ncbi:MAG: CHAT domain-containing protein [Blastocatellia bacterium]|nr:CHAT domain-containing protein [Blastocatellia bacterium]
MKIKYRATEISPFIFSRLFCRVSLVMAFVILSLSSSGVSRAHSISSREPERIQDGGQQNEYILLEARTLEPGTEVERRMASGKTHSYSITLARGDLLRVVVDQKEIDVFVRLLDADGKQLAEARNYLDTARPERLSFVADEYNAYRLDVTALGDGEFSGSYMLRIEPLRPAMNEARALVAAERLYGEAEKLHAQGRAESLREAISKYEQSLALWQQARDRQGEADTLNYLAAARRVLGESEKALELIAQALSLYRAIGDRRGESQTLRGLGLIHHLSGNLHKALEYYEQALPISKELKDRWEEAGTLNNIGGVYSYLGEHQQALEHYLSALLLHRELGNKPGEAVTLNNIGEIYRTLGEHRRALEYLEKSLPLRREVKDIRGEGVTLNNIAIAYASLGEYEKALDWNAQSLALRRTAGDRLGEASTLNSIGFIYHKLGEYDRALEFFNRALELRRTIRDPRGEANTLHQIGEVYSSKGETEKALEYFNQALPLSRATQDRILESAALYSMAKIDRARGNFTDARARIEASLDRIESLRSRVAGQELRETFFASKQDHYEMYIDVLMQFHRLRPSEAYDASAFEANERARARTLLDILTEARAHIRQGVDLALLERERLLQQQLNAKEGLRMRMAGRRNSEKQTEAIEREIENLLNQYREVRSQIRVSSPRYAALMDPQPLTLKEIQEQVLDEDTLLLQYSLGEERSYLWAVTQSEIASYALPPRARIEEAVRRVYELLTARNERPPAESAGRRQSRLAKSDDEYAEAARHLSRMILGPVSERMGKKRLIIAGEGALQYIPFGALPTPGVRIQRSRGAEEQRSRGAEEQRSRRIIEAVEPVASHPRTPAPLHPGMFSPLHLPDPRPLIADHEIINLPSASALALLRRESNERRPAPKLVAVLADPVFGGDDPRINPERLRAVGDLRERNLASTGQQVAVSEISRPADESGGTKFRRLRFSRQEADAIVALVPGEKKLKAVDFAANRATVTSSDLGQYRILHFATHGLLNSENPELSGIVLSLVDEQGRPQDGFLRLHEIYNLRLSADLVVLSACRTALGKEIRGEGIVGLVRGFMYAGAPRVVASLWNVEDRATAELMKRFYREMLSERMTPAAALRAAQVSMWKEKRWEKPYYWAGFTMQGEWR